MRFFIRAEHQLPRQRRSKKFEVIEEESRPFRDNPEALRHMRNYGIERGYGATAYSRGVSYLRK